jgi:hypothetical protein
MTDRDPKDPDPATFRKAMRKETESGRPDVAARAAEAMTEVGPEDEVRSDPEAPDDISIPQPPPLSPPKSGRSGRASRRR